MAKKDWIKQKHPYVDKIMAYGRMMKRPTDEVDGLIRTTDGGATKGFFHYAPTGGGPSVPLKRAFYKPFLFLSPKDCITDAVEANIYEWNETKSGTGTPLAPVDAAGGGVKFTNAATDNSYYFYELGGEPWKLSSGLDLWFRAVIRVSDATQSDLFVGLCQRLASGNLFDNRVNCVGFRKDDGDASIDCVSTLAGSSTSQTAQATLTADVDWGVGFHWDGVNSRLYFYISPAGEPGKVVNTDSYKSVITATLPTTEMTLAFGLRNGEAVAKVMTLRFVDILWEYL